MNVRADTTLVQINIIFDLFNSYWAPGQEVPTHGLSAACCDANGKWTQSQSNEFQTWICEKLGM